MKTIKLYHITSVSSSDRESYYSLEPWEQPTTDDGMIDARHVYREDDGGKDYLLPDDGAKYEVGESNAGEVCLWRNGAHVEIMIHRSGRPQLAWGDPNTAPVLDPA